MHCLFWALSTIAALSGPSLHAMQAVAQAVPVTAPEGQPTLLTSVKVSAGAAGPIVSFEANGPLPVPTRALLQDPPRVYFDLSGVRARSSVTECSDGIITRIRVALHSADPAITRVVIDLSQPATYAVNVSQRLSGRIDISLQAAEGARTSSAAPAAPAAPAREPAAAPPAAARRPPANVRSYLAQVSPLMQRLAAVVPVLAAIDSRSPVPRNRVEAASAEIALLRGLFASIQPPRAAAAPHGMLMNACALGSTALSLVSTSKEPGIPWDAASAAAGALILIDRARAELSPPEGS